jgi:hypothetical protein
MIGHDVVAKVKVPLLLQASELSFTRTAFPPRNARTDKGKVKRQNFGGRQRIWISDMNLAGINLFRVRCSSSLIVRFGGVGIMWWGCLCSSFGRENPSLNLPSYKKRNFPLRITLPPATTRFSCSCQSCPAPAPW